MTTPRTVRLLLAAGLALGLLAAACGGGDSADSPAESGETRTIEHALGTVEVPVDPQRIASVGYEEQQSLYTFGKVPVILREYWGEQPYATWPWDQPYLGNATPDVFTEDMPYEKIAAAEPDLIMAMNAGLDEESYARLSEIAPTVAHPEGLWDLPDPDGMMLSLAAQVFGMEAELEEVLAERGAAFAAVRDAHPEWTDMVVGSLTVWDGIIYVDQPSHSRGQLLAMLGFRDATEVLDLNEDGDLAIPVENIDQLDVFDAVVWINGDPTPEATRDLPLRTAIATHVEGREILAGFERTAGFGTMPHASLWTLEWLVPALEQALDGDPATPVEVSAEAGIAPGT